MKLLEYAQYLGLTIEDVAMKIALECVSRLEKEIGVSEDTYCYELVIKRLMEVLQKRKFWRNSHRSTEM